MEIKMSMLRDTRLARIVIFAVMAVVILGVGLNSVGLLDPHVSAEARVRYIAGVMPSLFFIIATGMIARAFKAIDRGDAVETALGNLLGRLGLCLFLGSIAFVFAQPLLLKLFTDWSAWVWFDVPSITLGCLGLLLFILARPLRDAGRIRAELNEIL